MVELELPGWAWGIYSMFAVIGVLFVAAVIGVALDRIDRDK